MNKKRVLPITVLFLLNIGVGIAAIACDKKDDAAAAAAASASAAAAAAASAAAAGGGAGGAGGAAGGGAGGAGGAAAGGTAADGVGGKAGGPSVATNTAGTATIANNGKTLVMGADGGLTNLNLGNQRGDASVSGTPTGGLTVQGKSGKTVTIPPIPVPR